MLPFGAGAPSALSYALVHTVEPLTILGALLTDFRTFAARVPVMRGAYQHEMCGGAADFCAGHHQSKVFRFDVVSARLKAMVHGSAKANSIASETSLDAVAHFWR
jgi:hypothetical protein